MKDLKSILAIMVLLATSVVPQSNILKLDSNQQFKIVQINNLFLTSDQAGYFFTANTLSTIIDTEKPNLVVFTGDTIAPYFQKSYKDKLLEAVFYLELNNIPWVMSGPRENIEDINNDDHKNRTQLLRDEKEVGQLLTDQTQFSLSGLNSSLSNSEQLGIFTEVLEVVNSTGSNIFNIWILDSQGNNSCSGNTQGTSCISSDAVRWFTSEVSNYPNTSNPLDMIFMSNPIQEFMTLSNTGKVYGIFDQDVCCQAQNNGVFQAALDSKRVSWIIAGSDASNSWTGTYQGINLAYGQKTGYNGLGDASKMGARVFLYDDSSKTTTTWIRQGNVGFPIQTPTNTAPTRTSQQQCCTEYDNAPFYDDGGFGGDDDNWIEINDNLFLAK